MNKINDRAAMIEAAAAKMGKKTFVDDLKKVGTPRLEYQKTCSKVVTLEEAIRQSGLKDGLRSLSTTTSAVAIRWLTWS